MVQLASNDFKDGGGGTAWGAELPADRNIIAAITGTLAAPNATALVSSLFNKETWNIVSAGQKYARVRLANGSTAGDFIKLLCDPTSDHALFIEQFTALSSGERPAVVILPPGAYGTLRWNGTEWEWFGYGEIWWWTLRAEPAAPQDLGTWDDIGRISLFEDGIYIIGRGASASQLSMATIPFSNGQAQTMTTRVNHTTGQSVSADRIAVVPVSDTIAIAHWNETASPFDANVLVATRDDADDSLTFGTTELVTDSTSNAMGYNTIIPFGADYASATPSFWYAHTITHPDTAYYPEFAKCTIAGTGASAAVTRGTGKTSNWGLRATHNSNRVMVEDPVNQGHFWALTDDDGSNNASVHLTRFTDVSGYAVQSQRIIPRAGWGNNQIALAVDLKDKQLAFLHGGNYTIHLFEPTTGDPTLKAKLNEPNLPLAYLNSQYAPGAGWFGGVIQSGLSGTTTINRALRYSKAAFNSESGLGWGSDTDDYFHGNNTLGQPDKAIIPDIQPQSGPLVQADAANVTWDEGFVALPTYPQIHPSNPNTHLARGLQVDSGFDGTTAVGYEYEIASASRWKRN